MGLNMSRFAVCCLLIYLDQEMEISLIPMKVMNYYSTMGKC